MSDGARILYLVPYFFAITLSIAIAIYAWRRRAVLGATPFAARSLLHVLRVIGFVLILISPTLEGKIFWDNLHNLGMVFMPVATLTFVIEYTGRKFPRRKTAIAALSIIPTLFMVLSLTDSALGLLRENARIYPDAFFPGMIYDYTLPFWVTAVYGYTVSLVSIGLLVDKFIRSQPLYRAQIGSILLGTALPVFSVALTISGVLIYRYTIAYFATIGDLIILWGLFRFRLLDITPIAHHAIFRNMTDGVIILDNQDRLVDYNPTAQGFVNRLSPELIGQSGEQAFSNFPDLVTRFENVNDIFTELEVQTDLGYRHLEVNISPLTNRRGRALGRMIVIHDVTEQNEMQTALRESEEEYRRLVESSPDWVWSVDAEGNHTFSNQAILDILGYSPEEIYGTSAFPLMHPDDQERIQKMVQDATKNQQGWKEVVIRWQHKDSSVRYLESTAEPILDAEGHFRGFNGIDRDITTRVLAEEEINRYAPQLEAANKELEAFSYSVSHDLRAPLRAITGFSEMLIKDKINDLDEAGQKHLRVVHDSSLRMGELINDLLRLSRVSRGELTRSSVDLSGIAKNILEDLQKADAERKATFIIEPNLRVEGDMRLVRIMLENLLGNAWKFTGKQAQAEITFGCESIEGRPVFFIRDNGVGINMEYADKIFDPFQRLHSSEEFEGTGIGLATVQRIIHRHNGRVWAEGEEGQGATIYFTL
jgi:PAS domain S-box-containing protein